MDAKTHPPTEKAHRDISVCSCGATLKPGSPGCGGCGKASPLAAAAIMGKPAPAGADRRALFTMDRPRR